MYLYVGLCLLGSLICWVEFPLVMQTLCLPISMADTSDLDGFVFQINQKQRRLPLMTVRIPISKCISVKYPTVFSSEWYSLLSSLSILAFNAVMGGMGGGPSRYVWVSLTIFFFGWQCCHLTVVFLKHKWWLEHICFDSDLFRRSSKFQTAWLDLVSCQSMN